MEWLGIGVVAAMLTTAPLAGSPLPAEPALSAVSTRMIVEQAATAVATAYQDPADGAAMAADLRARLARGGFDDARVPGDLAVELTTALRAASHDLHLGVSDPLRPPPASDFAPPAPSLGGFGRVELTPEGVGYIRMVAFPPISIFRPAADFELAKLRGAKAIVLDLRTALGGDPKSATYLDAVFDSRARNGLEIMQVRVAGTRRVRAEPVVSPTPLVQLPGAKLYVLIGGKTFSAPEQAAYDLQALGRATLVGAQTRGGANPTQRIGLAANLSMDVPSARARNRITGRNWEGVGVRPDVPVQAAGALQHVLRDLAAAQGWTKVRADGLAASLEAPLDRPTPPLALAQAKLRDDLLRRAASGYSESFPADLDDFASPPPSLVVRRWGALVSVTPQPGPTLFGERDFEVVFKNATTDWFVYLLPDGAPGAISFRGRRLAWSVAGSSQSSAGLGVLDSAEAKTRECYTLMDMRAHVRSVCVQSGEERRLPVGWGETACRSADRAPPPFPCEEPARASGVLLAAVADGDDGRARR